MKQMLTLKVSSLVGHTARFGCGKKVWVIENVVNKSFDEGKEKPTEMRLLILTSPKGRSVHERQTREVFIICGENKIQSITPNSFRLFYEGKRSLLIFLNNRSCEELSFAE